MSLTLRQQGKFRRLVDAAWKAHAGRHQGLNADWRADHPKRDAWYRQELRAATGLHADRDLLRACRLRVPEEKSSTTDCNQWEDFNRLMAHFEALVMGGSIYWQMRLQNGPRDYVIAAVRKAVPEVLGTESWLEPLYLEVIAQKTLKLPVRPRLWYLSKDQLRNVVITMTNYARRAYR